MAKADATATWSIDLVDNTSNAAMSASQALRKLQDSIESDQRALRSMQAAMKNLQQGASVNIDQFRALKASIDAKKQSIASAQASYLSLGGSFEKAKPQGLSAKLAALQKQTEGMPGPLQSVVGKLGSLAEIMSKGALVLGLVAVAAAMVAVTAAAIAGTAALLQYGIASANARRNEGLRLEGMTKMRNWMGIAAGNSKEMQTQLDRVSGSTSLGRDKLEAYQRQLYQMGLRGEKLGVALEATAIKGAVLGEEGAKSAMHWAAGLSLAGGSLKKFADDIKGRYGKVAAAMMLDLNVQAQKMREAWALLFTGLNIEGLLKSFSTITSLFSQSTASGRALKTIVTVMLQPLIGAIEYLTPYARRFWQGLIIGALTLTIGLLRVRNYLRAAFDTDTIAKIDATKWAVYAGVGVFGLLATMIGLSATALGVGFVAAMILAAPFIWSMVAGLGSMAVSALVLAAPFILTTLAIGLLIATVWQLYRLWEEIDWTGLGTTIVEGLVNGVKNAWKWLTDTMGELGDAALGAFKDALGIASPSRAFTALGEQIPAGVAKGINQRSGDAQAAADGMVRPDGAAGSAAAAGGRGGVTINVGGVNVQTSGGSAASIAQDIEQELTSVFERLSVQFGGAG